MSDQEITAELEVKELVGEPQPDAPTILATVTFGAKTDLGRVRENNEDKFDWLEPETDALLGARGRIYAVADGMGGHAAGQIASELALKTVIRTYYAQLRGDVPTALTEAVRAANRLVWETSQHIPGRSGMGTTLTALALYEDRAILGQVGDSRAYLLRDGEIEQVTEDHSWVAEQVRAQMMTLEEAEASPYRNIITRSIGATQDVFPDLFEVRLQTGDLFLLCSDGLSGVTDTDDMREALLNHSPSMAANQLIELANERGGPDNITCFIVRIDDLPGSDERDSSPEAELATRLTPPHSVLEESENAPESKATARRRGLFGWRV